MRDTKIILLIPRIETEHRTQSCHTLCPLLGAEYNQRRAPASAAPNPCVFAAEIPPTHTLGTLGGLNTSNAFVGFLNTIIAGRESDLQMKPE